MTANRLHVFTGLWLLSALVHAQSGVAGRWTSEGAPGGAATIVLQLTVKGSVVDGTITLGENPTQAVSDGKTEGNNVTFKTVTMLNGEEVPMIWEGQVQENKLTLTRSIGSNKLAPTVLQRSTAPARAPVSHRMLIQRLERPSDGLSWSPVLISFAGPSPKGDWRLHLPLGTMATARWPARKETIR